MLLSSKPMQTWRCVLTMPSWSLEANRNLEDAGKRIAETKRKSRRCPRLNQNIGIDVEERRRSLSLSLRRLLRMRLEACGNSLENSMGMRRRMTPQGMKLMAGSVFLFSWVVVQCLVLAVCCSTEHSGSLVARALKNFPIIIKSNQPAQGSCGQEPDARS